MISVLHLPCRGLVCRFRFFKTSHSHLFGAFLRCKNNNEQHFKIGCQVQRPETVMPVKERGYDRFEPTASDHAKYVVHVPF